MRNGVSYSVRLEAIYLPVGSESTYSTVCRTGKEYGKKHWILTVQKCTQQAMRLPVEFSTGCYTRYLLKKVLIEYFKHC
jgi:hypothetical protein